MLAIILGGMSDVNNLGSLWGIAASPSDKAWSMLASVGNIWWVSSFSCAGSIRDVLVALSPYMVSAKASLKLLQCATLSLCSFAFNCLNLVVEIQATLREPPASSVSMKKSLYTGEHT